MSKDKWVRVAIALVFIGVAYYLLAKHPANPLITVGLSVVMLAGLAFHRKYSDQKFYVLGQDLPPGVTGKLFPIGILSLLLAPVLFLVEIVLTPNSSVLILFTFIVLIALGIGALTLRLYLWLFRWSDGA